MYYLEKREFNLKLSGQSAGNPDMFWFIQIHKKWKDSLETRAEPTVLHAYVENQVYVIEFL